MTQKQKLKATQAKEKKYVKRPGGPVRQGQQAQYEEPDLLALQRAVANPVMNTSVGILTLQHSYGNRAVQWLLTQRQQERSTLPGDRLKLPLLGRCFGSVQRILYNGNKRKYYSMGEEVMMETNDANKGRPNCHGHTYGTVDTAGPEGRNPLQSPHPKKGVRHILANEAQIVKTIEPTGNFNASPKAGQLIVVYRNKVPVHSTRVTRDAAGKTIRDVTVDNWVGYDNSLREADGEEAKLNVSFRIADTDVVALYNNVPGTSAI